MTVESRLRRLESKLRYAGWNLLVWRLVGILVVGVLVYRSFCGEPGQ